MGTRLEPTFNPLANSSAHSRSSNKINNNNNSTLLLLRVQRVNDQWQQNHFKPKNNKFYTITSASASMNTGLDNFQEAVNKMLQKGDVDAIRKTMQLHENVFKNQVKELHRLYSVQRRLMEEVRKESKQNALWDPNAMGSSGIINHLQLNNQSSGGKGGLNFNLQSSLRDDPISSAKERSGSCSGDNMRMSRGFDLERPAAAEEDMSTGVSTVDEDGQAGPSAPTERKSTKMSIEEGEESDVELSLSIGGSSISKKRSSKSKSKFVIQKDREIRIDSSNLSFKSERGEECSDDPTTPMSSSSATCDNQETKRPHWLFQSLKLK